MQRYSTEGYTLEDGRLYKGNVFLGNVPAMVATLRGALEWHNDNMDKMNGIDPEEWFRCA